MSVVYLKKTSYGTKINQLEKKLNDHNHDKHINTPELNTLAADAFNAGLVQSNNKSHFEEDGAQNY